MQADQLTVLRFWNGTCKTLICQSMGIDYHLVYGRTNGQMRLALPQYFMRRLMTDMNGASPPSHIWDQLLTEAVRLGVGRCVQIVFELSVYAQAHIPMCDAVITALADFYEERYDRTCTWMVKCITADRDLLGCIIAFLAHGRRSGLKECKRALAYAHWVASAHEKVFLDVGGHEKRVLWRVSRAYEHTMFGRHNIDDMTAKDSPLNALLAQHHDAIYTHTRLSYAHDHPRGGMIICGKKDEADLVIRTHQKPFPAHHYRGTLEMLSDETRVYCDSRSGACVPRPATYELVFDRRDILSCEDEDMSAHDNTRVQRYLSRLADFQQFERNINKSITGTEGPCQKAKMLEVESSYEEDSAAVSCHVQSYLLWSLGQYPLRSSTAHS